jgi:hypothetical protein
MIISACLLSVAMLISAGDVAQAKSRTAAACGKELQSQCIGMPSLANNMLACLAKARVSARCMQWRKMLCAVVKETQFSFAKP